ncbi:MAG: nicotinate-nucleotide adenylyltransferase [Pseudomonadales bacterium]|nr:nicotinate-nucleotide adenylyltransferase [Pseudomonadales bacterium]
MSSRLGVLGGMFDPVHRGHIAAARFALTTLKLDRVKLIPCNQPNHRDPAFAQAQHRLAMLRLATQADSQIEVDDCEIVRGGVSYSVDTLSDLSRSGNFESIVFVLGMDSLNTLPRWHQWQSLFDLCHLMVLARNGQDVDAEVARQIDLDSRLVSSPDELHAVKHGKVLIQKDFDFDVSSTRIRNAISERIGLSQYLADEVSDYIRNNSLYS